MRGAVAAATPSLLLTCVLLLAGCGGTETVAGAGTPAPTTAPPAPATNARGNVPADLGADYPVRLVDAFDGEQVGTLALTGITVDPPCDGELPGGRSEHGHLVRLDLRVTTPPAGVADGLFLLNRDDWAFVGADGAEDRDVDTYGAFACLPRNEMLSGTELPPGQTSTGAIVVDVPEAHGALAVHPHLTKTSYEWTF